MTSANIKLEFKSTQTGEKPVYSITAGGFRDIPLMMSLGEHVTTTSPLLVGELVPVLERHFTGGLISDLTIPIPQEAGQEQNDEAVHVLRLSELYFNTHLPDLLAKFDGQFVAIIDFRVVDNDPNLDKLMERVYKRFGYRPILMRRVQKGTDRPSRLPSTKQARRLTRAI